MDTILISPKKITYKQFIPFLNGPVKARLSKIAIQNISKSQKDFSRIKNSRKPIYGVNTGFGNLSQIKIDNNNLEKLQINLVKSHASGIGDPIDLGTVRIIIFLKILNYAHGYSGIRLELVEMLLKLLNNDILPLIPKKGSVGASGDLAPLGHLALVLIGEGKVFYNGKKYKTKTVLDRAGIKPIILGPKEGLSLINGTQVSTALAIKASIRGCILTTSADIAGALSVENSFSSREVFRPILHKAKLHPGQRISAKNIYRLLVSSEIIKSHKNCDKIQDPYSFRCIPHVHGASRDSFYYASRMVNSEINSVSDNPLVINDKTILNSGHFHAEHVAQAMDIMAIAFSELGSISERRTHYFMKGIGKSIPPFVTENPGLESGYMIAHVTSTALASENKTLSHPASTDSMPTSGGQEDLVSMAPWAGYKLLNIQKNLSYILAIEMIVAGAANNIIGANLSPSKGTAPLLELLRNNCKYEIGDRSLSDEIETIRKLIISGGLLNHISKSINLE